MKFSQHALLDREGGVGAGIRTIGRRRAGESKAGTESPRDRVGTYARAHTRLGFVKNNNNNKILLRVHTHTHV